MSASEALQKAIYTALVADFDVASLIGGRVYDGVPDKPVFPYVSFGPTDFAPEDADCITARRETVQIDVWSRDQSRLRLAKVVVDAVYAALHDANLPMDDPYALAELQVVMGTVRPDPDGITAHGILQFNALVETVV